MRIRSRFLGWPSCSRREPAPRGRRRRTYPSRRCTERHWIGLRGQDIMELEPFVPLEPGNYFIDPDGDPSTPLRVVYEIPAEGWSRWIGAAKPADASGSRQREHHHRDEPGRSWVPRPFVGRSTGRTERRRPRDRARGPGPVPGDLASGGRDHLRVQREAPGADRADEPAVSDDGSFIGCEDGKLKSWVASIDTDEPGDAFYGYTGPGYTEEFWILDVEGTRLMIAAERSPDSPPEDLDELRAILDSIRIEP